MVPTRRRDRVSAGGAQGLPPRAARYVLLVVAAGGLAIVTCILATLLQPAPAPLAIVAGGAAALSTFVLQRRGFVFHWRGQRTTSTLDEPAVFFALLVLPPAPAVLAVVLGIVGAQVVARRKPVKAAYNVTAYALSAAGAALAYGAAVRGGADPLLAGAGAVAAYAALSNLFIAHLFARIESAPWPRIFRERFARATLLNAVFGYSLVVTLMALWRLHPAAPLALGPFLFLALSFVDLNARADREVRVRRQLEEMTVQLVSSARVDAVAEQLLDKCGELFLAGEVELELPPQRWTRAFEGGRAPRRAPLEAPVLARDGSSMGTLRVWPAQRAPTAQDLTLDRPLLAIVAAQAGGALEIASAVRQLVGLKEVNEGIVRAVPAGILRVDAQGEVVQANAYFEKHVGPSREAWAALRAHPQLASSVEALLKGCRFLDLEVSVEGRTFSVSGVPVTQAEEAGPGAVILFHDLTLRKTAEEALRSQTLTRPLVRRIVLDLVGRLGATEGEIGSVGRRLAQEVHGDSAEEFASAFRSMGLGELRFRERAGGTYTFQADDLLERRARATQPTCHLARGYVEGLVSILHGGQALGTEVRCQSQGHPQCVFVVKPREETVRAGVVDLPRKRVPEVQAPAKVARRDVTRP